MLIRWNHTGSIGPSVSVYWLKNGGPPTNIGAMDWTEDLESYPWSIPSDLAVGDDYQILVECFYNSSIFDYSGFFSIQTVPSISLITGTTEVPYQEKVMVADISDPQDLADMTISLVIDSTSYNATVAQTPSFVPTLPIGYAVTFVDIAANDNVSAGDYFLVTAPSPSSDVTITLNMLWGTDDHMIGFASWTNSPPAPPSVSLSKSTTGTAHQEKVMVADISDPQDYSYVRVSLVWNSTSVFPLATGTLSGTPGATGYTVTFIDLADDGRLSAGDYFLITSSGDAYTVTFNILWGSTNAQIGSVNWTTF